MLKLIVNATTISRRASLQLARTAANLSKEAERPKQLEMSDRCVRRLKDICGESDFLRIAVEGGGCSGFQYTFELDTVRNSDDVVFEKEGSKVVVDEVSLPFLEGATLDYQEELIRSSFRIVGNPRAELSCSCGTSFAVKSET